MTILAARTDFYRMWEVFLCRMWTGQGEVMEKGFVVEVFMIWRHLCRLGLFGAAIKIKNMTDFHKILVAFVVFGHWRLDLNSYWYSLYYEEVIHNINTCSRGIFWV